MNVGYLPLATLDSSLGKMIACANQQGICLLEFADEERLEKRLKILAKHQNSEFLPTHHAMFVTLQTQLDEYFQQTRKNFDIPLSLLGTDFQCQVWQTLLTIPYGKTWSYQQQANLLQKPNSVRAVANANGQNHVSIIVPCHRVIGSNGQLTGYAGGLWRKRYLLDLEQGLSPVIDKLL